MPVPWTRRRARVTQDPARSAEEVVAEKLARFGQSRRGLAHALARRHQVEMPAEVEQFFDAVETGDWEKIEAAFKVLDGRRVSAMEADPDGKMPALLRVWPAIVDAYGAAQQVHEWPAQKLLDYGNAVLETLRPGMVYVGGTDNGRWIPELLNTANEGAQHIMITQNGLADGTYLDYLRLQYDERFATLNEEDSQRAFRDYLTDAQKRFEHDRQFPDEPKQVRPGEDIKIVENRVQVGGQVAVMSINERLLMRLMEKNPDLSFAVEESSPLRGTYAEALPLGPILELGAQDEHNSFTSERAMQSLDYWQATAQRLFADPEAASSPATLKSYSHDAVAAANLLAAHQFTSEAEQTYRLAAQLWPENPESIGGLADLLARGGRENEAKQLLADFVRQHPSQKEGLERVSAAFRTLATSRN